MFNVVVDNLVWTWLVLTVKYHTVVQEGLVINLCRCLVFFYSEEIMVKEWDSEWLQNALNVLVGLFCQYRLITNF